ncbi:MAG: hypothetical protein WBD22_13670 [Pyrinomonadaceae bacterium]
MLLCILCMVVAAVGGAAIGAYAMKNVHERWVAMNLSGSLTLTAMYAEQIKMGGAPLLLESFERTIPNMVVALDENGALRNGSMSADTALMAVKRFYVCTKTDIPENIAPTLAHVQLAEDACPPEP